MTPSQSYSFSGIVVNLYFFFLFSFILHTLASPTLQYCRHDQRDALLEFKHEFPMNLALLEFKHEFPMNLDGISIVYYDMSLWNKSSDCCSWGSVDCDAKGQVISLHLDSVPLNNTLKPNSSLFKLQYLQNLILLNCNLYGEIPSSFGNLSHLTILDLERNELVGQVPPSLGNLSHLTKLDLSYNKLVGQVPASIGNLTQLSELSLSVNQLNGKIPVSFANLTELSYLELNWNYLESELPPDICRLHNLEEFDVSRNSFVGPFPTSLFTIPSLQSVDLERNHFKGPIDFGNISLSSRLQFLSLRDNKFDGPIPESISKFLNLEEVDLSNNSFIGTIPISVSQLVNLSKIDLSNNKLEGKIPSCLWRLAVMKLSHNSFRSFGKSSEVLDQAPIRVLGLDSNLFRGPFPHWICKLGFLEFLDLSNNSFSGSIPPCLRNFTNFIKVLILGNNNFSGTNLKALDVVNATNLKALDVVHNRLHGKLPISLINCKSMEILNVGSNKFKDTFPYWLGSLPMLNVIILRSNQFYGLLNHLHVSFGFQNLKVIDVSHNDFTGTFPAFYFSSWSEMTTVRAYNNDTYMEEYDREYNSMEMVHKGVDTRFEKIRKDFMANDLSRNRFCGKIPESIGLLKGLHLLNLSSNAFKGNIPQSLVNLTVLEALDLSRNQLSGQIPRDLGILSFLSIIDFSHNNLEGPIPRGTQFQSQKCSSFMDNPRLYGLDEICGKTHVLNPTPQESEELSEHEEQVINWIAAAIAYVPGVFCGLVIGHIFVSHKHEWFMEKFSRNKPRVVIRNVH